MNLIEMTNHIEYSIQKAKNNESKLTEEDFDCLSYGNHKHQMSSRLVKHLLNNLCSIKECRHLAIGLYKGGTLCASLKGNDDLIVTGIDNWSHDGFDPEIKSGFEKRFNLYDNGKVSLIEQDCFSVDVKSLPKFNFYFYDGEHTEEDQYKAIVHFEECLDDYCILLIDDYNIPHVQKGTEKGINDSKFSIHQDFTLRSKKRGDLKSWWNGIYMAVLKRQK